MSSTDLRRINQIEVPFVVVLGERPVKMRDILSWVPGSIVELGKEAEDELEVRINNKAIATGKAVKVGENFGVQLNSCGAANERIQAMSTEESSVENAEDDAPSEQQPVASHAGEVEDAEQAGEDQAAA
jgi:flagellar motor switch protein FliN/FliY